MIYVSQKKIDIQVNGKPKLFTVSHAEIDHEAMALGGAVLYPFVKITVYGSILKIPVQGYELIDHLNQNTILRIDVDSDWEKTIYTFFN